MSGLIRTVTGDLSKQVEFVPVDISVNAMIACAPYIVDMQKTINYQPIIFNNVSIKNPITWGDFTNICLKKTRKTPCMKALWYPEYYVIR